MATIKKLKISVAIATYNGQNFILKQLDSIRKQTLQPNEVIISDDHSSDNTVSIITSYIRKFSLTGWKVITNVSDNGVTNNFLNAFNHTTGDIIFLCDQDDIWRKDKIKKMIEPFYRNEDVNCVISSIRYLVNGKIENYKTAYTCKKSHEVTLKEHLAVCSYLGMASAFRKEVYLNTNKEFMLNSSHDWAMFIQAIKTGKTIYIGEPLSLHRFHDDNASSVSGNSEQEKRINMLNRQIAHIMAVKKEYPESASICDNQLIFLESRKKMILQHQPLKIATKIYSYINYGYTLRNYAADIIGSVR